MAVSLSSFKARFPEFDKATDAMVSTALEEAARNVDAAVFGDKADDAVRWKAAHLLAISPWGRNARLISKDGSTTYGKHFDLLARSVTPGFRVA